MHLVTTADLCRIITTGGPADLDVHASYADYAAGVVTPGRANTKITTATTTTVVGSPGASTIRKVKALFIANVDTTDTVTVELQHYDGTTAIQIEKIPLAPGERIAYREGVPTRVIDANGAEKTNANAAVYTRRLAVDQSNSTVTPTAVAGLTFACPIGTWIFEYFLNIQSGATTTGVRLSANHTGTVTTFLQDILWPGGTTAAADAVDQDFVVAGGQLLSGFFGRVKSTAGLGTTTSVDTANADTLYIVQGLVVVTADGNMELWHGSEVAAISTVKAGSVVRLTKAG